MKTFFVSLLALALLIPSVSYAASKPSVTLDAPTKGASYGRTEEMPVSWTLENINRDMVVVTKFKLLKRDTSGPSVGFSSDSTYQHTVYANDTDGGFTHDWGLNDTIPGKYSVSVELHACNKKGCDYAPAGKLLSKKGKAVTFTVRNTNNSTSGTSGDEGTTVEILSPNGGEKYDAGSGKKLTIRYEADNVPKKSKICTSLEQQGGGTFVFPGGGPFCKSVKDGKGSVSGKLIQTAGYNLEPGNYWVRVAIVGPASGGKDGPTYATDVSDDSFRLR